ncbi:MAG: complex I NDUFA9 subunit family protein [Magnetococcales bacterium]|nr:complex I NDUFA9 subunit family protein [Magnetococcales bacterium]
MILVTGCTGFLGSAIVKSLLESGHKVRGLARHGGPFKDGSITGIDIVHGSILEPETLARAMEGVEKVIHLVGILVETKGQTFSGVHLQGTKNVLQAAKDANVKRYLQMSSMGTRPHATSKYHQSKWLAEEAVRSSGLNITILRPSVIFGPYDEFTTMFAKMARYSPVLPLIGAGENMMQPVWVEDVAQFVNKALNDQQTFDKTYELGGPEQLTFKTILTEISKATNKRRAILPIPLPVLRLQAGLLEKLHPKPPLTLDQLIMAQEDNVTKQHPWSLYNINPMHFAEKLRSYIS